MKRKAMTLGFLLICLTGFVNAQDKTSQLDKKDSAANLITEQKEEVISISSKDIDGLINNIAAGRKIKEVVRIISDGYLLENPALGYGLNRKRGLYYPEVQTLVVSGELNGSEVIEDVHFLVFDEETLVVLRDIYLDGGKADLAVGRGMPFVIESGNAKDRSILAASPTISSITGVTNSASGITNGKADLPCGSAYVNGSYVINDQTNMYPWTINGNNFGTAWGTVLIAGRSALIKSWSNTRIQIDPTINWQSGGMSTLLKITTSAGGTLSMGVSIAPAIRSRIFGQCTYHVAYTRLQMGLQPSPSAYSGYTAINGSYLPRAGDQYQWGGGSHTGIAKAVSGPVVATGGVRTWTITISEGNFDCRGGIRTYTATFQTKTVNSTTTVLVYPKSSITKYAPATLYYR